MKTIYTFIVIVFAVVSFANAQSWVSLGNPGGPVSVIIHDGNGTVFVGGQDVNPVNAYGASSVLDGSWQTMFNQEPGEIHTVEWYGSTYLLFGGILPNRGGILDWNTSSQVASSNFGLFDGWVRDIFVLDGGEQTLFTGGTFDSPSQYLSAFNESQGGFFNPWLTDVKVYSFANWMSPEYLYVGLEYPSTSSALVRYNYVTQELDNVLIGTDMPSVTTIGADNEYLALASNFPVSGFGYPVDVLDVTDQVTRLFYTQNGIVRDFAWYTEGADHILVSVGDFDQVYHNGVLHPAGGVIGYNMTTGELLSYGLGVNGTLSSVEIIGNQIVIGGNFVQDAQGSPMTFIASWNLLMTGFYQYYYDDMVRVYPNPAVDYVTIEGYEGPATVYDICAKVVSQLDITPGMRLDVTSWVPGVYTVQFGHQTVRIVK